MKDLPITRILSQIQAPSVTAVQTALVLHPAGLIFAAPNKKKSTTSEIKKLRLMLVEITTRKVIKFLNKHVLS